MAHMGKVGPREEIRSLEVTSLLAVGPGQGPQMEQRGLPTPHHCPAIF